VFALLRPALHPSGTLWLNLGDTYARSPAKGVKFRPSDATYCVNRQAADSIVPPGIPAGLKPTDMCCIPWRVALALQADGWYLRQALPWLKRSAMPENVNTRPSCAVEYIFQLTPTVDTFYDWYAVRQSAAQRHFRNTDLFLQSLDTPHGAISTDEGDLLALDVTNSGFRGAHFATYPPRLVEPLIRASASESGCCPRCRAPCTRIVDRERAPTRPGAATKITGTTDDQHGNRDPQRHVTTYHHRGWVPGCSCSAGDPVPCTVLDPFCGSGTTLAVAHALGRASIGIDLYPSSISHLRRRLPPDTPIRTITPTPKALVPC
jgi:hypothetical protein